MGNFCCYYRTGWVGFLPCSFVNMFQKIAFYCASLWQLLSLVVCLNGRMEQETPTISGGLRWWAGSLGNSSKSYEVKSDWPMWPQGVYWAPLGRRFQNGKQAASSLWFFLPKIYCWQLMFIIVTALPLLSSTYSRLGNNSFFPLWKVYSVTTLQAPCTSLLISSTVSHCCK